MSGEITTLILRFRDLVTPAGGTIAQHKSICQEKGFAYWGWWNKTGEKAPLEQFEVYKIKAKESGLEIFLFDSGHSRLFKANCVDIIFSSSRSHSPIAENTPDYYKEQSYYAWFKFDSIADTETDQLALNGFAYRRVNEFFINQPSKFSSFYDKMVFSGEELRQQERTIWFVGPKKATDLSHELLLLDSRRISPETFTKKTIETKSKSILWMSDLHYSTHQHQFPRESGTQKQNLSVKLEKVLSQIHEEPSVMVISGDITWKATREEYDFALESIGYLQRKLEIENYSTVICPGNHDLSYVDDIIPAGTEVLPTKEEARESFEYFYEKLFYLRPNEFLCSGRRYLLGGTVPVEVVAVNSSILSQNRETFKGHGFIGKPQLDHIAKEMGWDTRNWDSEENKPVPFRIVVLHHHLLPVSYREIGVAGNSYSVLLDSEALSKWSAEHKIQLILHGHMHHPHFCKFERPGVTMATENDLRGFYIAGLGSTGVKHSHLGEIGHNTFGVIKFEGNMVHINIYSIDPVSESNKLLAFSFARKE